MGSEQGRAQIFALRACTGTGDGVVESGRARAIAIKHSRARAASLLEHGRRGVRSGGRRGRVSLHEHKPSTAAVRSSDAGGHTGDEQVTLAQSRAGGAV